MTFLDDLMLMCSVLQLVITQMCILKILTSNGNITIVVYFYSPNLLFSITKSNETPRRAFSLEKIGTIESSYLKFGKQFLHSHIPTWEHGRDTIKSSATFHFLSCQVTCK